MKEKQIELYDMGRTTHKAVPGMYEFIVQNAERYIPDSVLAERLKIEAAQRELPGHSISQEFFSEMCRIWVEAYHKGDFPIDQELLVFPDTKWRFLEVKKKGRKIGVLTSGSRDLAQILFDYKFGIDLGTCDACPPKEEDYEWHHLGSMVDEYFLGEEIGDKDLPETFARLWETRQGDIHSVYDDKISVCQAAIDGLKQAGGSARIYLVDRKGKYNKGELADKVRALQSQGVRLIQSFDEVIVE